LRAASKHIGAGRRMELREPGDSTRSAWQRRAPGQRQADRSGHIQRWI